MTMKLEALPKGFRFRPTDEELVNHYLRLKINGQHSSVKVIPEVDACKWEPWDLPALSVIKSDDSEWFFFCPRDRKYPNGHRSNRATEAGYWKATGKDRTIKSRRSLPSGCSNTQLIGKKKTLVFYKGRAPNGERTNWIMHEYRATDPDLDGSGPGQGDYVLCRLFDKANERLENLKYDELEPTGSSPSTTKSSPDDEAPEPFQEPSVLGTETAKESKDVKKQLTDEADCITSTSLVPVEICEDGVDHVGEETPLEAYAPVRYTSISDGATYDQFEDKVLDALQSHNYTDSGARIGSPFADDFGNDSNALHFQDGTSEKDVSLSELLEDLQNHDNHFYEKSSIHNIPRQIDGLEQTPNICKMEVLKIHGETDTEMVPAQGLQGQTSPRSFQFAPSTDNSRSYYTDGVCGHKQNTPVSGTGIKIQSRQPRNRPSSINSATQGTTPRRIRLSVECRANSVSSQKSKFANGSDEQKPQSLNTDASKDTVRTVTFRPKDQETKEFDENGETARTCDPGLVKHASENGSSNRGSFMLSTAFFCRRGGSAVRVYAVSIYLVIILSLVFLGMWRCPSFHDLHG